MRVSPIGWIISLAVFFGPQCSAVVWPNSYDELEDIMLLNQGYRARQLSLPVTPCDFERSPGRIPAAGFVRTAFHDVAHHDVATGQGGMDASIAWELTGEPGRDNAGPAFNNTLTFLSRYYSTQASMSDLLALALYTAVRGCGGPSIPIRTGRKDATGAGSLGVPRVNDTQQGFKDTFRRMGFGTEDMIKMVACGHTLGGVHSQQFPDIVPVGSRAKEVGTFDNTTATFDNAVAVQYVQNTTTNPLVTGPERTNSDKKVFEADGGATIRKLTDAQDFRTSCKDILQRMIDVVPVGVALTEPIQVYDVKPGALQLALNSNRSSLVFSGEIRVRTTSQPQSSIASVKLVLTSRSNKRGSLIPATAVGTASGYDESFTFYSFSTSLDADAGLKLFDVIVTSTDGSSVTYNNGGQGFPVEDSVLLQVPDCSMTESSDASGKRTVEVVAAIRGTGSNPSMTVALQTARDVPFPLLTKSEVVLARKEVVGSYVLYKGTFQVTTPQINSTSFDLGTVIDQKPHVLAFNKLIGFGLPIKNNSTSTTTTTTLESATTFSNGLNRTTTGDPRSTTSDSTSGTSVYVTTTPDRGSPWIDWSPNPSQPRSTRVCGTAAGCDANEWASETVWAVPTPKDPFAHTRPAGTYLGSLARTADNDGALSKSQAPTFHSWSMGSDVKVTSVSVPGNFHETTPTAVIGTNTPMRPTTSSHVEGSVKIYTGDAAVKTTAIWVSGMSALLSFVAMLYM